MIFSQHGIIDKVSMIKQESNLSFIEDSDISFNIISDNIDNYGNLKLQYYYSIKESDNLYSKYFIKIKLNKLNNTAFGTKVNIPVYSSLVNAIPTISDTIYGVCNYLDKNNTDLNQISLLSRFVNIKRLCLYVVSLDGSSGNISLNVKFGQNEINNVIKPVTANEKWIYIENTQNSSGEITISRNNDSSDTLSNVCIITGIRVEME